MRIILIVFAFLISTTSYAQNSGSLLIRAGKLYDSEKKTFLKNQQILISDGIIQQVGTNVKKPKGVKEIDLNSCTATPGLIDMHTHLVFNQKQTKTSDGFNNASKVPSQQRIAQGLKLAHSCLQAGITTSPDLGNSGQYLDIKLQKELATKKGNLTLFVSGPILSGPGGQFSKLAPADTFLVDQEYSIIRNAQDAKEAVVLHARQGVNVIKVCADTDHGLLKKDILVAIVEAAKTHGLPVTAHTVSDKAARNAVLAGVNGIEHGYTLSDSTIQLMAQRSVYLVATDVSQKQGKIMVEGIGMKGKQADDYLESSLQGMHDRLKRAASKGVNIVFGSDYYVDIEGLDRGKSSVDVLVSYYEAGIPVTEVLQYATVNAAKALRAENQIGTIRKGMKADLVFFEGDLENDFAATLSQVKVVVKDGIQVK
ncbi:amidohydrolase family protein [Dyadobacter psychrophilus]|uniref:Imidazolonepropionase n=1 Tax=Dyadobacter psychrophilus TaxID=651661 RepID=A0A1T5HED0_9BACT|nr:amidohydrolase family protein [Dyadobacter psychrophilus]SKC19063.1 Imidazolonepropionase [Dyadobacter psychrophilus]